MKIFYQSMGVARQGTEGAYAQSLRDTLDKAAEPGTTVTVAGLGQGKAIADQYRYLEMLDNAEICDNGLKAEREGYDAFLIGNMLDPALPELREVLNIPVLGLCEASAHLACLMGAKFSVITVNERFNPKIGENIARAGLSGRLASIERMTVERGAVLDRAFVDPETRRMLVAQFTEATLRAADKGAEVVIPGGGIVMANLLQAGVHEIERIPVLNGVIALLKLGEAAARIRALTGGFTSRRLTYAPPTGKLLADIRDSYGAHVFPGAV